MQPYFLPYVGYFQLLGAVDEFVIYDNIKYTKKGWINRNRFLQNGRDEVFSLPLQKASDDSLVVERRIAQEFSRARLLSQLQNAYRKAPFFDQVSPVLKRILQCEDQNLFGFILNSVREVCQCLRLRTAIRISSAVPVDHALRGEEKVLAICKELGATTYINAIGGLELYDRKRFSDFGIDLKFIRSRPLEYAQFGNEFVPWLSIIDVLMFNDRDSVIEYIAGGYDME